MAIRSTADRIWPSWKLAWVVRPSTSLSNKLFKRPICSFISDVGQKKHDAMLSFKTSACPCYYLICDVDKGSCVRGYHHCCEERKLLTCNKNENYIDAYKLATTYILRLPRDVLVRVRTLLAFIQLNIRNQ